MLSGFAPFSQTNERYLSISVRVPLLPSAAGLATEPCALACGFDAPPLVADHSCSLRPADCRPAPVALAALLMAAFVALAALSKFDRADAATLLADTSGIEPALSTFCCADCFAASTFAPT
jgi:hypothetical protein